MKTNVIPILSKTTPAESTLEHAIRLRAYELYAQRRMAEGNAVHEWLAGEAELPYGHSATATDLNQKSKRGRKVTEGGPDLRNDKSDGWSITIFGG